MMFIDVKSETCYVMHPPCFLQYSNPDSGRSAVSGSPVLQIKHPAGTGLRLLDTRQGREQV